MCAFSVAEIPSKHSSPALTNVYILSENEKVEGKELREWLSSVSVPSELAVFIGGQEHVVLLN